jgi:hypothetical protein
MLVHVRLKPRYPDNVLYPIFIAVDIALLVSEDPEYGSVVTLSNIE